MLTLDSLFKQNLVYDTHAAPVLPYEHLPPIGTRSLPLALEYQARHALLGGFGVGKVLGLKPVRYSTGLPRNADARALDAVITLMQPDEIKSSPELMRALRQHTDESLSHRQWLDFMTAENERARVHKLKPPQINAQPQATRPWIERLLEHAKFEMGRKA